MAKIETPDPGLAEERFVRIFREHYPSVRAYVGRRAKSELVDDIVAETFLVAWRRLEDLPADARPWLLGVARKVLATQLRSRKRRESLRDRLLTAAPPAAEEERGRATPATEALARLREKDREAITLVAWDGLTPKQAAAVLGQSSGAFRVRLHRAKRRLRRELERGATSAAVARMVSVAREAFHE
jgi:RNA polymerase sigma-70 factor, ECF subfamily